MSATISSSGTLLLVGWLSLEAYSEEQIRGTCVDGTGARRARLPLGVAELARRQHIPERFLEQIFGELRRANIIESRRGAHGGYRFAMPTEEVSVLDIVEILDGEIRPPAARRAGCAT